MSGFGLSYFGGGGGGAAASLQNRAVIGPHSSESCGAEIGSSSAVPAASFPFLANGSTIYVPFVIYAPATAYKLCVVNSNTTGNTDMGIMDEDGVRLVSIGTTARTSGYQEFNIADTALAAGAYYLALAGSSLSGQWASWPMDGKVVAAASGVLRETVYPVPATATFAAADVAVVPMIGVILRSSP